ncbi:hypothetical protein [Nocardioides daphniae]|uniref:Uncharacterized protein n=1 Tax=Nocardioides daphniae TaxID=402297 RepID=A0A4P7UBB7_9ACTN|nr:hypothetical protein [Nocardioides daphniae]QCC76595.1 hypothetical protein E2C04_04070 [Nocardioides daphniae]GGD14423.1 hypothetical protein GCM10007231_11770 [Nocardioides daphniae]
MAVHDKTDALVPFPVAWVDAPPTVSRRLVLGSGVGALLGGLGAVALLLDGEYPLGFTTALIAAFFGASAHISSRAWRWPGRRRPLVDSVDGIGLRFRAGAGGWRFTVGAMVAGVPFGVALGWAAYHDPTPTGRTWVALVNSPILLGWCLFQLWNVATGCLRRGEVLLTPEGVTYSAWGDRFSLPWDRAARVDAELSPGLGRRAAPGVRVTRRPGFCTSHERTARGFSSTATSHLPDLVVRADQVEGDPALLAHALAFYATHHELLEELGDARALERVRSGRAVAPHLAR